MSIGSVFAQDAVTERHLYNVSCMRLVLNSTIQTCCPHVGNTTNRRDGQQMYMLYNTSVLG